MFRLINKLKNRKGFTLIELIVVLAVLAIIMAIAVPRFIGVRDDAKKDSDEATLASIAKLAELEYVRLNESGDLSDENIRDLVNANFPELADGNLFQTITTTSTSTITVDYDNGKVTQITINGTDHDKDSTTGAFELN